jgi:uncharacterized protein (DUF1697 family)
MTQYVAFLRGVNVGGHNMLKMEDLRLHLASLGFDDVSSYRQSGNVIFESSRTQADIESVLGKELRDIVGVAVEVFLRPMARVREIIQILQASPFKVNPDVKLFVTFLSGLPVRKPELPMRGKDFEVVFLDGREAFSIASSSNGRFGAPNDFIEARLGVSATTRNWKTVTGIAALKT